MSYYHAQSSNNVNLELIQNEEDKLLNKIFMNNVMKSEIYFNDFFDDIIISITQIIIQ